MEGEMKAPKFVKLLECERDDASVTLAFLGEDGKRYRAVIAGDAISATIDALQNAKPKERQLLTLTVLGHQPVARPDAKALVLRTLEWGSIAFAIPQEGFARLREDLAKLEAIPTLTGTKQ
jgi:hypothetical protein